MADEVTGDVYTLADLRPGDIGFGPIGGIAGPGIRLGELLVAPFDHWSSFREWKFVQHCGTVTEAATPGWTPNIGPLFDGVNMSHGPMFAQAEPRGYQEIELGAEHWNAQWVYLRPNYSPLTASIWAAPGQTQAEEVALIARTMAKMKIPYGFEDYAAIAAHRAGAHVKPIDHFIARTYPNGIPRRAICSQGVDAQLSISGGLVNGKVFDDERLPQDVTPSELYLRLLQIGVAYVFRPGVS
jgi:hypothetical protein